MNTYIFIPDTDKKAGLGHLFRCLKYSNFVKKPHKIIFLIKYGFKKKYLINRNLNKIKINYIFFKNLKNQLKILKEKNKNIITFLDSYNRDLQKSNFQNFSNKHVNILDFKMHYKSDYTIDHTFKRKAKYHYNYSTKIFLGVKNFPISNRLLFLKKEIILINFGSVNDELLIKKSLIFLKKLKLSRNFRIVIISRTLTKRNFDKIKIENKIIFHKFIKNIDEIYRKTFFSFGACGISLYDKCFYNIPSISKCLAKNQYFNFKNFSANGCILDFDRVTKMNVKENIKKNNFLKSILKTKQNIRLNFDYRKNKKNLAVMFKKINEN